LIGLAAIAETAATSAANTAVTVEILMGIDSFFVEYLSDSRRPVARCASRVKPM